MEMLPVPLTLVPPAACKVSTLAEAQVRLDETVMLPVPEPAVPVLVVLMVTLPLFRAVCSVVALTIEVATPELGV